MRSPRQPHNDRPSPLALAKEALRIPALAAKRGWEWKPGRSCRCPYRADRNESGSVLPDGKLFHDFASGETLDAPALLGKMEGLDARTAAKLFIELAGIAPLSGASAKAYVPPSLPVEEPWEKPVLPPLAPLSEKERRVLAELRGLSVEAVEMAHRRGLLWGLFWRGHRAWALTDAERWNCQWRRLDGGQWERHDSDNQFKSWGVRRNGNNRPRAGWPIGICEASGLSSIAMVEGGPDLLAAFHFLHLTRRAGDVGAVCMFGISRIDALALPYFTRKRVRLFCHADPASLDNGTKRPGLEAAARWTDQLVTAGCTVDAFDFSGLTQCDGQPVCDLNDLAHLCEEDFEAERETLESLMNF